MTDLDLDAIKVRAAEATGTRYGFSMGAGRRMPGPDELVLRASADDQPFVHLAEWFPLAPQGDIEFIQHARGDVANLVAEVERLRNRIADAAAEADSGMYGDPENPFRVRAHLEPENLGKTFGVDLTTLRVPLRIETTSDSSSTGGQLSGAPIPDPDPTGEYPNGWHPKVVS